jgi:hypothetical protein
MHKPKPNVEAELAQIGDIGGKLINLIIRKASKMNEIRDISAEN